MSNDWIAAYLRATDVQSACSSAAVRWPDALSKDRRSDLLTAGQLAHSIANAAQEFKIRPDQPKKIKAAGDTQLKTAQLISDALAEARMKIERESD